jgi:hypothetical protein
MALERPLVSLVNLCTRGAAISAIRNGPQMYSVRNLHEWAPLVPGNENMSD